jgi:hypothetical protein
VEVFACPWSGDENCVSGIDQCAGVVRASGARREEPDMNATSLAVSVQPCALERELAAKLARLIYTMLHDADQG